jgi:methionyl-tRNA formyltransferase
MALRIAFMGSPDFAVPTLEAVLARHEVVAVVTQPDKPSGRGRHVEPPPVKLVAERAGVPVLQPRSARTPEFLEALRAYGPDVAVVVAYGKILPQAVLDVPRHGCLNVHGSLLPRYRGAAPIQWAIIRGETETGITIMKLDAGMDTGPMLLARAVAIGVEDTAGTLAARLAPVGAELMLEALARLEAGTLVETAQDGSLATLAPILKKEDGRIDWTQPATAVRDRVRGVDPWPGATASLDGEVLKMWRPLAVPGGGAPGEVIGADRDGLLVACGDGAVALGELQLPGRKRLGAGAFLAGRPVPAGTRLS